MKRIAKILVARDYTDDESYEMFQASIQLAKLDALGDFVVMVLEDVRAAMQSEDPQSALKELETSLKKDMSEVNTQTKALRPKAEKEMETIRKTLKQKREDKEKADKEEPLAANVRAARNLIAAAKKLMEKK